MKIALVSYDFAEYCIRLASALSREAEVLLLLPDELAEPHLWRLDPAVNLQPFTKPRLRQGLAQLRTAYSLVRRIQGFDPDVMHLMQGHLWFNLALPLLSRYPLVITAHDPRHHVGDWVSRKTPQWLMDAGFRRASRLIVHSENLRHQLSDRLGIPDESVHANPTVVRGDDGIQPHVQEEDRLILFFGRIWEYKGLDYLIRAEPLITSRVPDAKIVIAGKGEEFDRYERMMVHPDRFEVHNEYVSDEMRAELFRRASVVVLPYTDASQSGVIPFAYTFSKPVVATTVGGLPDLVDHGHTGYLVPPADEKALAEAIVPLLLDDELRRRMGANGHRKINTENSAEAVAKKTMAVYREAVQAAGTSAQRRQE